MDNVELAYRIDRLAGPCAHMKPSCRLSQRVKFRTHSHVSHALEYLAGLANPLVLQANVGLNELQVKALARVKAFKTLTYQFLQQQGRDDMLAFTILVVITKSEMMANLKRQ